MNGPPIAILSFNRPNYLKKVLASLKAQTPVIDETNIYLFQDGHKAVTGEIFTDPTLIVASIEEFNRAFPKGKVFPAEENLGVALNYDRAEKFLFEELAAEAGVFFEDDLVLSPHYVRVLGNLIEIALNDARIGYVAAYGNHKAPLADQQRTPQNLVLMNHKWGFGLTRRQYLAQRDILKPYLEIVRQRPYRKRDHEAIRAYYKKLGYGSPGTSQDATKDVASAVLGTTKIMTYACFGKYIGDVGLHATKEFYDKEGFGKTEIYPDYIDSFSKPTDAQIESWISGARAAASLAMQDTNSKPATPSMADNKAEQKASLDVSNPVTANLDQFREEFVRAIYRTLLLREPDAPGMSGQVSSMKNGKSIEDVVHTILKSSEFKSKQKLFVNKYFS